MLFDRFRKKFLTYVTIACFSFSILPAVPASAALIGNEQLATEQTVIDDRSLVKNFMDRADVREKFKALGVDNDEAQARVDALSNQEVSELADNIREAPAGAGVGGIIGAAVLIFLVLLITDILGFTNVFDFTNKGSANPT